MSKNARLASVIAAVAIAAAAFIALRPSDDTKTTTATQTTAPVTIQDGPTTPATTTTTTPAAVKPKATVIKVTSKSPVGGVKKLTVKQGEVVRFTVTSDQAENVHLHGYDIEKPVGPGANAKFSVPAKITGVFEVELEDSGVQIAKLTVEP